MKHLKIKHSKNQGKCEREMSNYKFTCLSQATASRLLRNTICSTKLSSLSISCTLNSPKVSLSGATIATFEKDVVNLDFAYRASTLTSAVVNFIPQDKSQSLNLFWSQIVTSSMAFKKSSTLGDLRKLIKIIPSNEDIENMLFITNAPYLIISGIEE